MPKYEYFEATEAFLEDLIRREPTYIEEGLKYIDHQVKANERQIDLILVDAGRAVVVAELKVIEDDGMLVQGLDYYDYISGNLDGIVRAYSSANIDPRQTLRLFLVAPSFSVTLLNRCKWLDLPVSLYTFRCIKLKDKPEEIIPVFNTVTIPTRPAAVERYTIEERLEYITNQDSRELLQALLVDIKNWHKDAINLDPTKSDISLKVSNRVFAYVAPRRDFFVIYTNDKDDKWTGYPIRGVDDLNMAKALIRSNFEKLLKAK